MAKNSRKEVVKEVYTFRLDPRKMSIIKLYAAANDTNATKILEDAIAQYQPLKKHLKLVK